MPNIKQSLIKPPIPPPSWSIYQRTTRISTMLRNHREEGGRAKVKCARSPPTPYDTIACYPIHYWPA